jgi:hypothetical protein
LAKGLGHLANTLASEGCLSSCQAREPDSRVRPRRGDDHHGPPRLRATLYRALALVPGVQLLGEVRDRLGREAIGVAFTEYTGLRQELLFDPQTAEVLNERQVVAHPMQGLRAAPGTIIEDIVYTKRAVTDATTRP